jgi:hypothetical protein
MNEWSVAGLTRVRLVTCRKDQVESLILAQNERWRRA